MTVNRFEVTECSMYHLKPTKDGRLVEYSSYEKLEKQINAILCRAMSRRFGCPDPAAKCQNKTGLECYNCQRHWLETGEVLEEMDSHEI